MNLSSSLHSLRFRHRLRLFVAGLVLAVAGCAAPPRSVAPAPAELVAAVTWRQVDSEIGAASALALGQARDFAQGRMEEWRRLVGERTEREFIPWFSGYWTQNWLTARVAWYKLTPGEGQEAVADRLAAYLQEQYQTQVLNPVAASIDPAAVRAQAARLYVRRLGREIEAIGPRHGISPAQFAERLQAIPVIALGPPASRDASLRQLLAAEPPDRLPAFAALLAQSGRQGEAGKTTQARISPVARRASEKMLERLAISGGSSAASALVGGVAGSVISIGAAAFGIIRHESERADLEAQLRASLGEALDDLWAGLMDDPASGVTAPVHYLAGQVENSCPQTYAEPVGLEPLPEERPLNGANPAEGDDEEADEPGFRPAE